MRAWLLNALGIALLVGALLISERGGLWTFALPGFLVVLLILALLYRRQRRGSE
ncbi:MAG TPA: hypothetical protein VMS22_12490 [Candidatus Eisenbacteria bacterium]|nr:hypothetical protein [Candidatus Eisenbacteria bacterium]